MDLSANASIGMVIISKNVKEAEKKHIVSKDFSKKSYHLPLDMMNKPAIGEFTKFSDTKRGAKAVNYGKRVK